MASLKRVARDVERSTASHGHKAHGVTRHARDGAFAASIEHWFMHQNPNCAQTRKRGIPKPQPLTPTFYLGTPTPLCVSLGGPPLLP